MALSRTQAVVSYRSQVGGSEFLFDVVLDSFGELSIRNIRGPFGPIRDSASPLPAIVMADMQDALGATQLVLAEQTAASGEISFAGDTSKEITISEGVLNNALYRVVYTTPDGTLLRTTDLTSTGFTAQAEAAYGTSEVPIVVGYVILVATVQTSSMSGQVTMTSDDGTTKTVTFAAALPSNAYRVLLSPGGFNGAVVKTRTRRGFTIQLSSALTGSETLDIGYDVFA